MLKNVESGGERGPPALDEMRVLAWLTLGLGWSLHLATVTPSHFSALYVCLRYVELLVENVTQLAYPASPVPLCSCILIQPLHLIRVAFCCCRRYVEPLVENVTQLRNHRKFQEGDTNTVSKFIRQQLSQQGNAAAGAYCVAIDAARPGTGCIAYGAGGPESSIYREWFNITPKGE